MYHDLIIVGGGSCGIVSAIKAKDLSIDVAIIDSSDRVGKKLLITGNGRCNLTNEKLSLSRFHSDNNNFFKDIINTYVLEYILRMNLSERNIPTYMNEKVLNIINTKKGYFEIITSSTTYTCKKVLLCTGGKSYTKTGSDGSGHKLAKNFGHRLINLTPGIVQLKLNYDRLKAISGVKFESSCNIEVNGETKKQEFGEILFTDYGISGPPILQLSRIASKGIMNKSSVIIHVNLLNSDYDHIVDFFETHFAVFSYRSISDNLVGIINKKLIPIILKECGITDIHMPTYSLEYEYRFKLYKLLCDWKFQVIDTNSFENAQVTIGGIDTTEVNPITLESTLTPGLYFGGEILDVDGDCGGFNLQWCWSSSSAAVNAIYNALKD